MKKRNAEEILGKYKSGNVNEEERALAENWLLQEPSNFTELSNDELLEDLQDIRRRIFFNEKPQKRIKLWPRYVAAASILLLGTATGYFFTHKTGNPDTSIAHAPVKILPGKNGAVLTLANGSKIVLELTKNGTIAQQSGAKINKTNDSSLIYSNDVNVSETSISYNTLQTPRGRQFALVLPDGTKIWLNAASSIKYPTVFTGLKERKVYLTGEAYFEVTKDKIHPFEVITRAQEVRVLGTHFNVNSYRDESSIVTTLFEGSVKINGQILLKPGQQADLNQSGKLSISTGSDNATAWKDGKFRFEDTSIEEILKQLSRWYDVDIIYPNGIPQETFSGYIDRQLNLSDALEILKYTKVNFKIEGKKIYVLK